MIRSKTGVSNIPVNPEIDPGFGPDTEQRRVEFAAKLEEEAFNISLGDATKLAKSNLITALHIWKRSKLVPKVKHLILRDIMIIWLIFFTVYIVQVWSTLPQKLKKKLTKDEKKFLKFLKTFAKPVSDDIPSKLFKTKLDLGKILKIRKRMGGDLIFAIREKNHVEVNKLYEITYNKLPKSLRDEFFSIITGVDFGIDDFIKILKTKKNLKKKTSKQILDQIKNDEEYQQRKKAVETMQQIINIFDSQSSNLLEIDFDKSSKQTKKEVQDKVKKYYGIQD